MAGLNGISTLATALTGLNGSTGVSSSASQALSETKPETASATATDQANVSSTGGLVAQALNTSDVRTDKVAALQSAIQSGTYSVSSSDVASKIVDSLLD